MATAPDLDEVHQVIGEFVVFFQSVEDMYRQLGWQIVDPEKRSWPPMQFGKDTNRDLIDKVTDQLLELIDQYRFSNGAEKSAEAEELRHTFHSLRRFRNAILHSAYHEVVAGGKVLEILRSNPRVAVDPETGEVNYDQEVFEPESIRREIGKHASAFFKLHALRLQVIHWYPYASHSGDA